MEGCRLVNIMLLYRSIYITEHTHTHTHHDGHGGHHQRHTKTHDVRAQETRIWENRIL